MRAPTHTFKVQAVYKLALAFTFCLCRNCKSNSELLLVDKLGSSPFPWFLLVSYPQCTECKVSHVSSLPEPQECVRALSPLCLSHPPDLPFTHLAEILSLTSIAGLGSCDVWLFTNDPYCFQQCGRGCPLELQIRSAPFNGSVHKATMPQTCVCRGWGFGVMEAAPS